MSLRSEIENTRSDSDALAKMAEKLGYRGVVNQLQCNNGAFVSSLLAFFDDNPGACEAVVQWVLSEGCTADGESLDEEENEEDCDEEDEDETD